jgi:hypothetical protein
MSKPARERQVGGDHYSKLPIQPVEYAYKNGLGPHEFLALRYLTRHRDKNGRQDLEKAIHTIELLIEEEYPDQ